MKHRRRAQGRSGFGRRARAIALALTLLAGCQTTTVIPNTPLAHAPAQPPSYEGGYRLRTLMRGRDGEVALLIAFSGGGKRSAAFAHGALRGLAAFTYTRGGQTHRLLDDAIYISGVSGGSFPAAHYGLYRDRSFETFPRDFLYQDINSYIWGIYLLPWNWEWLVNPLYGTNDHMAQVYDRLMFHGATYADLIRQGPPLISVNATDIVNGNAFGFTQSYFDYICSDLTSFPIARAVAASNGFPVLFSPVTLTSYRGECGATLPPDAPDPAWRFGAAISRKTGLGEEAWRYLDPSRTHYVHLMDGGISDNLALRNLTKAVDLVRASPGKFASPISGLRRVIVLSVDGEAETDPSMGRRRIVTGLGQILGAVSGAQIDSYNFETMALAQGSVTQLVDGLNQYRCAGMAPGTCKAATVKGALVRLSLRDIADDTARARLQAIPTGLTIPRNDVDALVKYGEQLVLQSADLRAIVDGLD